MIKLKSILREVFDDIREADRIGEKEYEIEFDGIYIPGLMRPTDLIKINIEFSYDFDAGYPARGKHGPPENYDPGEGASVNITGHKILSIKISDENKQEREVDLRFLHPEQLRVIKTLVDSHIKKNSRDIESEILDGWES